jgi:hypothetical protein
MFPILSNAYKTVTVVSLTVPGWMCRATEEI